MKTLELITLLFGLAVIVGGSIYFATMRYRECRELGFSVWYCVGQ